MENIYPKLALCGRTNECARTDTVFFPISGVSEGMISLMTFLKKIMVLIQRDTVAGLQAHNDDVE